MSNRVPLRSLLSSYIGGGWGKEEFDDGHPEPAYVIRGTDFADAEYGSMETVPYRFHKSSNLAGRRLETNEIVMEVSGGSIDQPVGRVMYVDEHVLGSLDGPVMCASFCKRVVPNSDAVHPPYLYWYLKAVYASGLIERYQVQSTGIRNLQFEYLLDDLPVHLPPREEQERAVAVLDAILEALRSNRRRIAILEEMARLVYSEWFVQFRIPGHEDVELVYSEAGHAPAGWEPTTVAELVRRLKTGPRYTGDSVSATGKVPVIDQSRAETLGFHDDEPGIRASPESPVIAFGDHTCRIEVMIEPFSVGPNVVPFTSPHVPVLALAQMIDGLVETREYKRHWSDLQSKNVVLPPSELLEVYANRTTPLAELIRNLKAQNRSVSDARDLLLPRLISGELDVSTIEMGLESVE